MNTFFEWLAAVGMVSAVAYIGLLLSGFEPGSLSGTMALTAGVMLVTITMALQAVADFLGGLGRRDVHHYHHHVITPPPSIDVVSTSRE